MTPSALVALALFVAVFLTPSAHAVIPYRDSYDRPNNLSVNLTTEGIGNVLFVNSSNSSLNITNNSLIVRDSNNTVTFGEQRIYWNFSASSNATNIYVGFHYREGSQIGWNFWRLVDSTNRTADPCTTGLSAGIRINGASFMVENGGSYTDAGGNGSANTDHHIVLNWYNNAGNYGVNIYEEGVLVQNLAVTCALPATIQALYQSTGGEEVSTQTYYDMAVWDSASGDYTFDPFANNTCTANGTINMAVDTDGTAYGGANVYVNGVSKGQTDNATGALNNISLSNVGCDTNQTVEVRCSDATTICDTQITQIDGNNDSDNLTAHCSLKCGAGPDLYVSQQAVWVNVSSGNVTATVFSKNATGTNVFINMSRQDSTGLIINSTKILLNVTPGTATNVSTLFNNLSESDFLHVWVDYNSSVLENDETNNYAFRRALKPIKAYVNVSVNAKFSALNTVIREYLASYVDITDASTADIGIRVRQLADNGTILWKNGQVTKPYGASVIRALDPATGKDAVYIEGVGVEGDIAGVKRLINSLPYFSAKQQGLTQASIIDDYDQLGISVFDQMHTKEAQTYYVQPNTPNFQNLVKTILFDNNVEVSILPVKTLNTTSYNQSTILRVKHVSTDFSSDYRDAIGINDTPIVFSGGIFSNIETWEDDGNGLARQLANDGRDVWEIEITGGPNNDCPTCPNYTFDDLVDYYWPASMAGIVQYSGKTKVNYVGHSNGGRVALSALNKYSLGGKNATGYFFNYSNGSYASADLPSHPVDRFVGVAVPIVLNKKTDGTNTTFTFFARRAEAKNLQPMQRLQGLSHVAMSDYAPKVAIRADTDSLLDTALYLDNLAGLLTLKGAFAAFGGTHKISYSLMQYYHLLAVNDSSTYNLSNVSVGSIHLFNGNTSDLIVPFEDQNYALNSAGLNSSINKTGYGYERTIKNTTIAAEVVYDHPSIKNRDVVKNDIRGVLR